MNIRLKYSQDEKVTFLALALLAYNIPTTFLNLLVNLVFPGTPIDTAICMMIYFAIILFAAPIVLKRMRIADVTALFVCVAIILLHAFIYNGVQSHIFANLPTFVLTIFIWFFVGRSIKDYSLFFEYFKKLADVMVVVGALYLFIKMVVLKSVNEDDMSFSYYYLPFCIVSIHSMFERPNLKNLLLMILGIISLISCGTRGPILISLIAMVIFAYTVSKKTSTKIITSVVFALLIAYFLSDAFYSSLEALDAFLKSIGINNRIVEKFLNEELLEQSGRDELTEKVLLAIKENPALGLGLYSDRIILSNQYAHNVVLEVLLAFGVPLGAFILLVFAFLLLRTLSRKDLSVEYKNVLIIFVLIGFVKLFISSSFLREPVFYMFLGILFSSYKQKNGFIEQEATRSAYVIKKRI